MIETEHHSVVLEGHDENWDGSIDVERHGTDLRLITTLVNQSGCQTTTIELEPDEAREIALALNRFSHTQEVVRSTATMRRNGNGHG